MSHLRTCLSRPCKSLRRLRCELLERREMMTADPGWEFGLTGTLVESGISYGYDINVAPDGSIYTLSTFTGTVDADPSGASTTLTSNSTALPYGYGDGLIAKYTSDRELIWARRFGGFSRDLTRAIDFDSSGNVYISGAVRTETSAADFGAITLPISATNYDAYVAKLNSAGDFLWVSRVGGSGLDVAYDVTVTPNGDVVAVGEFVGAVDFDPGTGATLLTAVDDSDAFVWKLNSNGQLVNASAFGGVGSDEGHRVAFDAAGNVYFNGVFSDAVPFGSAGTLTAPTTATYNGFLTKLDPNGSPIWARQALSDVGVNRQRLDGDLAGNVYWSSEFSGSISLDAGTTLWTASGTRDTLVSRIDSSGTIVWSGQIGGSLETNVATVRLDSAGAPMFAGYFSGSTDLDPGVGAASHMSGGGYDGFLLRLDASGNYVLSRQSTGPLDDQGYGVASDSAGSVYWSGSYLQSVTLPTGTTLSTTSGLGDFFLTKIAPLTPSKFFVTDAVDDKTHEYDVSGNRTDRYELATSFGNTNPRGAVSNATGDRLWVLDANKKVYVYDNAGNLLGSWTANGLTAPQGIATNGTDVWIVDNATDRVYRYTGAATRLGLSQNAASNFKLNNQNANSTDLVTDGASIWVVNDSTTDKVFKYSLGGSLLGSWTIDGRNTAPTGITINPASASSIYILDNARDQIFEYTNAVTRIAGSQTGEIIASIGPGNLDLQGLADPPPHQPSESNFVRDDSLRPLDVPHAINTRRTRRANGALEAQTDHRTSPTNANRAHRIEDRQLPSRSAIVDTVFKDAIIEDDTVVEKTLEWLHEQCK